jgi:molecular chaperone GrpE
MVKKNRPDQHETKQEKHNETPDSKENNTTHENITDDELEVTDTENKERQSTGTEETPSDNVEPAEKSLEEKLAEMQDKYLRLSAEFDNYRRRTLREKMELAKYGGESLLLNILPLIDDFERALSHMESATDCVAMKKGIDLIYVKLMEFLKQSGISEIESLDCDFNVDLHHAVAKNVVGEKEKKGKIIEVVQKGYYLQGKVLRHSKVVVGE